MSIARITPVGKPASALDGLANELVEYTEGRMQTMVAELLDAARSTEALHNRIALNVTEAAALIGVSRSFLMRFVVSGELPSVSLGEKIRLIRREALEHWLVTHETRKRVASCV